VIWDTGFWSGDVRGVLGLSTQRFDQNSASMAQVGDLGEYERAEVVAARLTLGGHIGRMKAPESISRAMAGQYLTMAIRAVPISVLTASRENGIRLTNTAFDQRKFWAISDLKKNS